MLCIVYEYIKYMKKNQLEIDENAKDYFSNLYYSKIKELIEYLFTYLKYGIL